MNFPGRRMRRLRSSPAVRRLVRRTGLAAADFIYPLCTGAADHERAAMPGIPGGLRLSGEPLVEEARQANAKLLGALPHRVREHPV